MSLLPYASLTHRRRAYRSTDANVLLSSQTASNSASLTFSSGIDSTYGEYIFRFYNINPATDSTDFQFQANATDSTSYDETITSTAFAAQHAEADDDAALSYQGGMDQEQGTAYQFLNYDLANDSDGSLAGELHLFNPSSTTYVKHFIARTHHMFEANYASQFFVAGYINTTTAIDDIQFKMNSGNFDGTIKLWGVL